MARLEICASLLPEQKNSGLTILALWSIFCCTSWSAALEPLDTTTVVLADKTA